MNYHTMRENSEDPDSVVLPNIQIDGENYDVEGTPALIATLVGHLRLFLFFILFGGDFFFNMIGGIHTMPDIVKDTYKWIQENKF